MNLSKSNKSCSARRTASKAATAAALCALAGAASFLAAQTPTQPPAPRPGRAALVARMNAVHKAAYVPFPGWDQLTPAQLQALENLVQGHDPQQLENNLCPNLTCINGKVNQDLNPYPKSVGGLAVDVTDPLNVVIASYDDRLGPAYTSDFLHVSTTAGLLWSDYEGQAGQYEVEEIPKGVTIDRAGHTYVLVDSHDDFEDSTDTSVAVQTDNNGPYVPNSVIDGRYCQFDNGDDCNEVLQAQGIRTDLSGGPADGTTYAFYTVFCNNAACEGGGVPSGSSIMKVASSPGFSQPFGAPAIWSGPAQLNTGGGSMVVDSMGKAHLFYLDYTHTPQVALYESTNGTPAASPVLTFADAGLNNPHWNFREDKLLECAGRGTMAFCAFAATQVGTGPAHPTPDIYLATINLVSNKSFVTRVNNDPAGAGKDHFNPSVSPVSDGSIYVSWFDDRADPANLKVDYFVGKSSDGAKTFAKQMAVNEVSFDPTVGVVGPSGAIAAQGDSSVKAVWTDTRDGLTQQLRSTTTLGW